MSEYHCKNCKNWNDASRRLVITKNLVALFNFRKEHADCLN